MTTNPRFWIALAVFQVVYGLAVFVLTRDHYQVAGIPTTRAGLQGTAPLNRAGVDTQPGNPGRFVANLTDGAMLRESADQWFKEQDYASAARAYNRLIELEPGEVEHYNNLGLTRYYLGQAAEAISALQRGADVAPDYQRLWLTLGFVLRASGDTNGARASLEHAVALNEESDIAMEARRILDQLR